MAKFFGKAFSELDGYTINIMYFCLPQEQKKEETRLALVVGLLKMVYFWYKKYRYTLKEKYSDGI